MRVTRLIVLFLLSMTLRWSSQLLVGCCVNKLRNARAIRSRCDTPVLDLIALEGKILEA